MMMNNFACSGLLTGKFKKGDKKAPKGTRMEFLNKSKAMGDLVPTVDTILHDDKYWALREGMEKIGHHHGVYWLDVEFKFRSANHFCLIVSFVKTEFCAKLSWRIPCAPVFCLSLCLSIELQFCKANLARFPTN